MAITIYTGNFSRYGDNPRAVGIAGKSPDWFTGREYKKLAPKRWIYEQYRQDGDTVAYTTRYMMHVLSKLNQRTVAAELGDGALLLCMEESWQFCHRQIVATWLMDDPNIIVREMTKCPLLATK